MTAQTRTRPPSPVDARALLDPELRPLLGAFEPAGLRRERRGLVAVLCVSPRRTCPTRWCGPSTRCPTTSPAIRRSRCGCTGPAGAPSGFSRPSSPSTAAATSSAPTTWTARCSTVGVPRSVSSAFPSSTASRPRRPTRARSRTVTRLRWTYDNADNLGIDKDRIGLYGLSAGGGLAAALALLARDRGEVPLAFELLDCPMLDDRQDALDHCRRSLRVELGLERLRLALLPRRALRDRRRPGLRRRGPGDRPDRLPPTASSSGPSTASATRTSTTRSG